MSPRYVLVVEDEPGGGTAVVQRLRRRGEMEVSWSVGAATVLTCPDFPISKLDGGMAIGRTIIEGPTRRMAEVDRIFEQAWGDYVTVAERGAGRTIVQRSPSGRLPAFMRRIGNATVISAEGLDLVDAAGGRPEIDWPSVAGHLAYPHLQARSTGLDGIKEILPGERLVLEGRGASFETGWTPWSFAAAGAQVDDPVEARAMVRRAVVRSVAGLTDGLANPMLELSGGLDSSILAAALRATGRPATAGTLSLLDPEGDERPYARSVAAHCGIPLHELSVPDAGDLTRYSPPRTMRPGLPAWLSEADAAFGRLAQEVGADAFISGTGGDCVFCSPASATPAADALRCRGPGWTFLRTAADIARLHDASVWRAAAMAARQATRPPLHRKWPRNEAFLLPAALPSAPEDHSWLIEPPRALPGKRSHIRSILAAMAHLDGYPRHGFAPAIFPLLSQPVIEACLRVPSWLWVAGGRNRAIARDAFRDLLPQNHVDRLTKGGMTAYCARAVERHRPSIRGFLLDGHLAASGVLDRAALDRYLGEAWLVRDDRLFRLLPLIDAEAWTRSWLGGRNEAHAPAGAADQAHQRRY